VEVIRSGEEFAVPLRHPAQLFTGDVSQRFILEFGEPVQAEMLFVRFDDGARTHWHSHAAGQIIHVLAGETVVQVADEESVHAGPGDTIIAAPGELHWHGADSGQSTSHAVHSLGTEDWFGPAPG
jgi:quercetin dioxygenase-like cupin family protein